MRVSTVTIYNQSVSSLNRRQTDFVETGQQIASGKRVVRPSDDPQAAAQALGVQQSKALVAQFQSARVGVRNALSQEESVLQSVGDAITRARTLVLQASNGSLSDSDRASIASELRGIHESVLGQANSADGNGRYLFGGLEDGSPPFVKDAAGAVAFVGVDEAREQRVDASRLMAMADTGASIFLSSHARGYVAEAPASNAGDVRFIGPSVVDTGASGYGNAFTLTFADDGAGGFTYHVEDGDGVVYAADVPYVAGAPVRFAGLSLQLEGKPADGDVLRTGPGQAMNADLFQTFSKAIATLEAPADNNRSKAALNNTLNTVLRELDNSLDNVLIIGASVGARLNELDTLDTVANARTLSYEQNLSDLVDLDYVKAVSDYTLRKVGLEAAQKAFVDVSSMSLFRML